MKKESRKKYICFGGMLLLCVALAACGNETGSEAGEPETDFVGADRIPEETAGDTWQQAYIDYIKTQDPDGWAGYDLIYLDDDEIPELTQIGNDEGTGCRLVSWYDGKIYENELYRRGFTYIERENQLCNSQGHMDFYYDLVYRLEKGKLVPVASGYYGAEDNANVQFDESGEPIYYYEWDGVRMSREEYEKRRNEIYDFSRAKDGSYWEGKYSAEEMIARLQAQGAAVNESKNERNLLPEELQAFADYVNERENYGFLLSVYDTPADVDLGEVFYNGAGIGRAPSEEEKAEYLAVTGAEEIYTDIFAIKPETINTFLMEKTGLPYEKMNRPLEWSYLEKSGVYCVEHGDTNYKEFICTAGTTADEKTFTLRFEEDMSYMGETEIAAYRRPDYELVVEKSGDGYRFLSNRRVTEEGQIAEQTFPVTVAGLGDVVFAAYEPDYDQNMQADVTFLLLSKKGEVLQTLSGVRENNIRAADESYAGVEAVSFPDYNDDDRTDIITITSYSYITGPDIGEGFAEVRVYSGSEHGYFRYEEDISEMIRAEIKTPTIQNVRDFLGDTN